MDWISVKDGLPEDDQTLKFHREPHMEFATVLVCGIFKGCKKSGESVTLANRILQKKTGIEYIDREFKEGWHWSSPMEEVFYWMPLPEPPKED